MCFTALLERLLERVPGIRPDYERLDREVSQVFSRRLVSLRVAF